MLQVMERKVGWCKRGALRHGRFPAQALVMIDEMTLEEGRAAMAAFPL